MPGMQLPIYFVDAFASHPFEGNPAAVCPLTTMLDPRTMQNIAAENAQAETAFFVPRGHDFELRWFTPEVEVPLCGHATLASAFIVFHFLDPKREMVRFHTASGPLQVTRSGEWLEMNLPSRPPKKFEPLPALRIALGAVALEWQRGVYALAVLESERAVRELRPDLDALRQLDESLIVSAPGEKHDFVSRFFAPNKGIAEDPVTGSSHCTLVPYWSKRLGKPQLSARQVSKRGGDLRCEDRGERVVLRGQARLYLEGRIDLGAN
jgi:PhzF family phenazine biosynthesis protein